MPALDLSFSVGAQHAAPSLEALPYPCRSSTTMHSLTFFDGSVSISST